MYIYGNYTYIQIAKTIDKSYELYIIKVQGKEVILCQLQQQN